MGLFGKDAYDKTDTTECGPAYNDKNLCDPIVTAKCAESIYLQKGWNRWNNEATACGCLSAPTGEASNIESKI
jgi:hypothetical protein